MMLILRIPVNIVKGMAEMLFGADPITQKVWEIKGHAEYLKVMGW